MSIKNESVQGDLSVSRNITAGGKFQSRGNATFDHDVQIKGWLEVSNLKDVCKGLYATEEALKAAYPRPTNGWFAYVGDTLPADVYRAENGTWVKTGQKGGETNIYLDEIENDLESLRDDLNDNVGQLQASSSYVTCTTGAGTAAKTVSLSDFSLSTGIRLVVKMSYANTATSPTLNINNTGAKALYYNEAVASAENTWGSGEVLDIYYNGTNYQAFNIQGSADANYKDLFYLFSNIDLNCIYLTGFGSSAVEAGATNEGDIFYNTSLKALRHCVPTNTGISYETVPYNKDVVYYNGKNGKLYSSNGSELVEFYFIIITGIGPSGLEAGIKNLGDVFYNNSTNLLRRAYITNNQESVASWGFETVEFHNNAVYYNKGDKKFYTYNGETLVLKNEVNVYLPPKVVNDIAYEGTHLYELNITIPMEGGNIVDGEEILSIYTDASFYNNCRSPLFIEFNPVNDSILSIDGIPEDYTLNIVCFDKDFNFIANVTQEGPIDKKTRYFKFLINGSTKLTKLPILNVTFKLSHPFREIKNYKLYRSSENYFFFSFDVKAPNIPYSEESSESYKGYNERYFDNGYIIFPPNYDRVGEASPLAIYVHGTNGYYFNGNNIVSYYEYLNFVAKNGYVVVDCSGLTNLYGRENVSGIDKINSKICPISLSCYSSLYNFVVKKFNVKKDGCYIFGKSSGGLVTAFMAQNRPIPVRAAAGLAPSLNMIANDIRFGCSSSNQVKFWLKLLGFTNIDENITSTNGLLNMEEMRYVISQKEKFIGFDPIAINSDLDYDTYLNLVANTPNTTYLQIPRPVYTETEGLPELLARARKYGHAPFKIWIAEDDTAVPIYLVKWYSQMVRRGGGVCDLRVLPSGLGGHHAVDNSPKAPHVSYQTKYSGVVDIPVAYAELVDWFDRW